MKVTFAVGGDMGEFTGVEDVECRELNGDWCLKVDGVIKYVGEEWPNLRVQEE